MVPRPSDWPADAGLAMRTCRWMIRCLPVVLLGTGGLLGRADAQTVQVAQRLVKLSAPGPRPCTDEGQRTLPPGEGLVVTLNCAPLPDLTDASLAGQAGWIFQGTATGSGTAFGQLRLNSSARLTSLQETGFEVNPLHWYVYDTWAIYDAQWRITAAQQELPWGPATVFQLRLACDGDVSGYAHGFAQFSVSSGCGGTILSPSHQAWSVGANCSSTSSGDQCNSATHGASPHFDGVQTLEVPLSFISDVGLLSVELSMGTSISLGAGTDFLFTHGDASGTGDLSHTLRIAGVTLLAADGSDVTAYYDIRTENGTQIGAVVTTPEPGTWVLLGTGLLAVGGIAARRRRPSA